jgi:hypothetical protein
LKLYWLFGTNVGPLSLTSTRTISTLTNASLRGETKNELKMRLQTAVVGRTASDPEVIRTRFTGQPK